MTDHQTTHDADEDTRNRDIKIYVNGDIVHRDAAKVSVYDSGFMLGDGIWEGMRLYNGVWAYFDEHMDRFFNSCKTISLDVGMDKAGIAEALRATAAANDMHNDVHCRLMLTRGIKDSLSSIRALARRGQRWSLSWSIPNPWIACNRRASVWQQCHRCAGCRCLRTRN